MLDREKAAAGSSETDHDDVGKEMAAVGREQVFAVYIKTTNVPLIYSLMLFQMITRTY